MSKAWKDMSDCVHCELHDIQTPAEVSAYWVDPEGVASETPVRVCRSCVDAGNPDGPGYRIEVESMSESKQAATTMRDAAGLLEIAARHTVGVEALLEDKGAKEQAAGCASRRREYRRVANELRTAIARAKGES